MINLLDGTHGPPRTRFLAAPLCVLLTLVCACGDDSSGGDGGLTNDSVVVDAALDAAEDSGSSDGTAGEGGASDAVATDAVSDAALPANIAFISSTQVTPGELGGLSGADAVCNARATAAGLAGTYVAWLSSSTVDAIDRLSGARGWVRTDGKAFADRPSALANGANWYPLDRDEFGQKVAAHSIALTATVSNGTASGGSTCLDWTESSGDSTVGGSSGALGYRWTSGFVPRCNGSVVKPHLYCFGVDHETAVAPVVSSGRKAFLSSGTFTPNLGITAADTLCQGEASAAGLTGTFRALLATESASARSRFSSTGAQWVRTDGIAVGMVDTTQLETSIHVLADGVSYAANATWVWSGATSPALAGSNSTCATWSSINDTDSSRVGSAREPVAFFNGLSRPCDATPYPVYCLQE